MRIPDVDVGGAEVPRRRFSGDSFGDLLTLVRSAT